MKRYLTLVTVTRREGEWVVIVPTGKGQDPKTLGGFSKAIEALTWAMDQGYQVAYRGLTYNDGGYLNDIPADRA